MSTLRDAVASEYGVQFKVLSTSKKLVALNENVFSRIETVDKRIRNHCFYSIGQGCTGFCVPYDYKGKHLLPTELADSFKARFNEYADERERLVKQVVDSWDDIVEGA